MLQTVNQTVNRLLRRPSRPRVGKDSGSQAKRHCVETINSGGHHPGSSGCLPRKEASSFGLKKEGSGQCSTLSHDDDDSASMGTRSLEARALEEKEFIRRHDTSESDCWFIVDVAWITEWKQFAIRGQNPPGPIDNSRLVDSCGRPHANLRPVDDYRGVNQQVWNYWHGRYGGGPVLQRKALDLYAPPYDESEHHSSLHLPGATASPAASPPGAPSAAPRPPSRRVAPPPVEAPVTSSSSLRKSGSSMFSLGPGRSRAGHQGAEAAEPLPCCDKCDGPHQTDRCPHFKSARDEHPDAWSSYGKCKSDGATCSASSSLETPIIRSDKARVVKQPADGSCLFHSLSYGLLERPAASYLREEISGFIAKNPDMTIADTAIKDWILYDCNDSVQMYADRMRSGTPWGGGIEMAVFHKMMNVNVHVYERCQEGYMRISAFESPGACKTVSVLYQGRMHYDAFVIA